MIEAGIVGGSVYAGVELFPRLAGRLMFELSALTSSGEAGESFPGLLDNSAEIKRSWRLPARP